MHTELILGYDGRERAAQPFFVSFTRFVHSFRSLVSFTGILADPVMALLSQTAVTLALIAAMALQPAVLWAVPAQCSAGASAVDRSVNGGCCQSELPATGNCCCGQLAGETRLLRVAADEAAACCAAEPA